MENLEKWLETVAKLSKELHDLQNDLKREIARRREEAEKEPEDEEPSNVLLVTLEGQNQWRNARELSNYFHAKLNRQKTKNVASVRIIQHNKQNTHARILLFDGEKAEAAFRLLEKNRYKVEYGEPDEIMHRDEEEQENL